MSRSGGELHPRGRGALGRAVVFGVLFGAAVSAAPLAGQAGGSAAVASSGGTFPMTPTLQQTLGRLQDGWSQWTTEYYAGNEERRTGLEESLLLATTQIGMKGLPDLAASALVKADEASREGEFDRAAVALETAEAFDPGRPETLFARSRVARRGGHYLDALVAQVQSPLRIVGSGLEWTTTWTSWMLWLLVTVSLAALLFLALQVWTKGPLLLRDLAVLVERVARRPLAAPVAALAVLVLLVWPLPLPGGLFWLAMYWSILLWGYGTTSERWVTFALWLAVGASPMIAQDLRERVSLELSPAVRAAEAAASGRLYGGLFSDLGVLETLLPGSLSAKHFLADVHLRLGQWEEAQRVYREVLVGEPRNAAALNNLGVYYLRREDPISAISYFRQAAEADPSDAAPHYNLHKAFGLQFSDAEPALARAIELGGAAVSEWRRLDRGPVPREGGIARLPDLRRQLAELKSTTGTSTSLVLIRRFLSLLVAVVAMLLALAFAFARQRWRPLDRNFARGGEAAEPPPLARAVVPGLDAVMEGRGVSGFFTLFALSVCLLLPWVTHFGFRTPWFYAPSGWLPWFLAAIGLLSIGFWRAKAALAD